MKLKNYKTSENLAEVQAVYKSKVKAADRPQIDDSAKAYEILKQAFNEETLEYSEEFVILLLNRSTKVLGWVKISQGGITSTVCDPKVIFSIALQTASTGIILAHNHPSGNTKPSDADRNLTRKLKEAGKLLDIQILDHIIIAPDNYYSFADEGLIY